MIIRILCYCKKTLIGPVKTELEAAAMADGWIKNNSTWMCPDCRRKRIEL